MQKKLIALAVAGLASTAAFAQSNVTIYGVVDAGYVYSTADRAGNGNKHANYSGIDSGIWSGSRIGFKGEEGLGNGLKAIFTLEYYIAPDLNSGVGATTGGQGAGATASNSRQTFVGLSHNKLGTVTLGRQYSAGFYAVVRNDAFGGAAVGALASANATGRNTIVAGDAGRLNNSVVYASPTFAGFKAVAGYSYGENGGSTLNGVSQGYGGVATAGLNYANGPLNVDLAWNQRRDTIAALGGVTGHVATQENINEWILGGSYDLKVAKLFASYQNQSDSNGTPATDGGNRTWQVGVTVPVFGNGKIHASYADLNWDRKNTGGSDFWAVGYSHALSKRTTLYTTYTLADVDRNVPRAAFPVGNTAIIGEKSHTFTAGINHAF